MNFKKLLKKKSINLIIINICIIVILLVILFLCNGNNDLVSSLKGYTKVDNNETLSKSYNNDRYVEIVFDKYYLTDYVYEKDNKVVAYYIDLDIDGKGLIAKVSSKVYKELTDGKINSIKGHLEKPVGEDLKVQNATVNKFVKTIIQQNPEYAGLEKDIAATYYEFQLDGYEGSTAWAYIVTGLFGIVIIINIYMIVKGVQGISHPERLKLFKNLSFSDIESEYDRGSYNYKTKNVIIANKYIYSLGLAGIQIALIDNVLWAYFHIQKRNGIQVSKSIVLKLKNKKQLLINDKNDSFFEALAKVKPNVLMGFTKENQKAYKEMTK